MVASRRAVLLSTTAFGQPPLPDALPTWLEVKPRRSDWGVHGWRHRLTHVRSALELAAAGRGRPAVVVAHVGIEAMVAPLLLRVLSPRTRIVLLDVLLPANERLDRLTLWPLRLADRVVVLRRGDQPALVRRAGVDGSRVRFVPYAVRALAPASRAEPYVYASGTAHRDWALLMEALASAGVPAVVATDRLPPTPQSARVQVRPLVSPDEGRHLAAAARLVVVPMVDTELPAGPLVLMDAMAMGQVVVATDANGTRDYVRDGVDGVLVPPGRPDALAAAIRELYDDHQARDELARAARLRASVEWTEERLMERLREILVELGVDV